MLSILSKLKLSACYYSTPSSFLGDRGAKRVAVVVSAIGGKPKVTDLLLDLVHASAVRNLHYGFLI